MEKLIVLFFVLTSTLTIWVKDIEIFLMDRAYRTVQYGLEHAVHDATLQVNKSEIVTTGKIYFLEDDAETALKETIQRNIPVDSLLRPTNILLKEPLLIKDIVYLDDDYIDPITANTISFPTIWKYEMPNGEIFERAIFGPSIALVVDVSVQGGDGYKTFIVIQEYKIN